MNGLYSILAPHKSIVINVVFGANLSFQWQSTSARVEPNTPGATDDDVAPAAFQANTYGAVGQPV